MILRYSLACLWPFLPLQGADLIVKTIASGEDFIILYIEKEGREKSPFDSYDPQEDPTE